MDLISDDKILIITPKHSIDKPVKIVFENKCPKCNSDNREFKCLGSYEYDLEILICLDCGYEFKR